MVKFCQNCGEKYESDSPNSKYCGNLCCIDAAKKRKKGLIPVSKPKRKCKDCPTLLSIYNHSDKCWNCQHAATNEINYILSKLKNE